MATHIHKKFNNEQVKKLLQKYLNKEVERKYLQEILGVGKSRFFELVQSYRDNPRYPVDIRIYILDPDFYELRFWYNAKLIKVIRQKIIDFLPVHF